MSVEVFGDNGKNNCFKTCDACRVKGRAQKLKTKIRQQDDKVEADVMELNASNNNEFVRCVLAHIAAVVPECKVSFENQRLVIALVYTIILKVTLILIK